MKRVKLEPGQTRIVKRKKGERDGGIYVLLSSYNSRQWLVMVVESDPSAIFEEPGGTTVINDDWLAMYTRQP